MACYICLKQTVLRWDAKEPCNAAQLPCSWTKKTAEHMDVKTYEDAAMLAGNRKQDFDDMLTLRAYHQGHTVLSIT
jgi:hypothetical protein